MLANLRTRDRILLGYASPLILFFGFSLITYTNSLRASSNFDKNNELRILVQANDDMILRLCLMSRQVKGYILLAQGSTENPLVDFNQEQHKFQVSARLAKVLVPKLPGEEQEKLRKMLELEDKFEDLAAKTIQAKKSGISQKQLATSYLQDYENIFQEFDNLYTSLKNELLKIIEDSNSQTKIRLYFMIYISAFLLFTYLAIAILISFLIIGQLVKLIRQVQLSEKQVSTSTVEIATSGKDLETMMIEQVESTKAVMATASQIATTSARLVKTMDEIQIKSQVTAQSASDSQTELNYVEDLMQQLANDTVVISGKFEIIRDKASNINYIVETITKVADQTNLLSLNAAIEADKAGVNGKGFAIIAQEIRQLADQAGVATLNIEKIVQEMQVAVSAGVEEMNMFIKQVKQGVHDINRISHNLELIIERVQKLNPRFQQVSNSVEDQSQGAVKISQAMTHLSKASTTTLNYLAEVNTVINQLNNATQSLHQEIANFRLDGDKSGKNPHNSH